MTFPSKNSADAIPDEVLQAALKIAKDAIYFGSVDWAADDIARALMARDDRAAKIALDWRMYDDEAADHVVRDVNGTCKRIAAAIRGGR